ncbi:MAG: phosphonate ABC transporter ATP-binding protein [Hyphomicrobiaceae bacterium]
MSAPALRIRGLSKSYGDVAALRDASLSIRAGEFVAVLGQSGSGKSTLFRCITRLTQPDAGEIFVGECALHGLKGQALGKARRDIGVVFQQFNLVRRRTALENVLAGRLGRTPLWRVATDLFSTSDIAHASDALDAVGLSEQRHQRADTLSGGQQQRVAIARALAQDSRILLADEPVASLDPETAANVLSLMQSLARTKGLAILCTLHQPQYAQAFADRSYHMHDGRLVAD